MTHELSTSAHKHNDNTKKDASVHKKAGLEGGKIFGAASI